MVPEGEKSARGNNWAALTPVSRLIVIFDRLQIEDLFRFAYLERVSPGNREVATSSRGAFRTASRHRTMKLRFFPLHVYVPLLGSSPVRRNYCRARKWQ